MSNTSGNTCPRILVVDDEAHLRELLEITLIKMGLDVDSAENLDIARTLLAKNCYSLVLTDMRLPDGSGMELVEEVNLHYKNTPIAVITAFGSTDNAVIALKAGAFDYVSKPVALDHLRKLVRSALEINLVNAESEVASDVCEMTPASFLIGSSPVCRTSGHKSVVWRVAWHRSLLPGNPVAARSWQHEKSTHPVRALASRLLRLIVEQFLRR
jgi:two-component system response regulator PilR (NtrC family)